MIKVRTRVMLSVAMAALLSSTVACSDADNSSRTDSGSHFSRVQLYPSVKALSAESSLVVVGTVKTQRVTADISPNVDFAISTVTVQDVVKHKGPLQLGSTVEVRQVTSESNDDSLALLRPEAAYMLFLTPSGLEGDKASQYYVTGANAGVYASETTTSDNWRKVKFKRIHHEPGEDLPEILIPDEVADPTL